MASFLVPIFFSLYETFVEGLLYLLARFSRFTLITSKVESQVKFVSESI